MEGLDYWRLCDELSVIHAALLIAGVDPALYEHVEIWQVKDRPQGYEAAKTALINAIMANRLGASLRYSAGRVGYMEECFGDMERDTGVELIRSNNDDVFYYYIKTPDWNLTTINLTMLKAWLSNRGFNKGFFFPNDTNEAPDYLNTDHSNYSPKLAAAIEAWITITDKPELTKARSVKQAIMIWLRSNAGRFGLIKEDGNPNENGIEEVAKVANWETKGGAPKTPEG